jgi:mannitol-1-phosphate 5-dehydrogenase
VDVTVEPFYEWAIERPPFGDAPPNIPGAHFVDDLAPYIERKLFTVNTGHATTAYFGAEAGAGTIAEALADPAIAAKVAAALEETSALLEAKHGLDADELAAYRVTILTRFANPALPDTVGRVGRQPLRKLSRHERFVGPAAEAAERGLPVDGLVAAMAAALRFDDAEDEQSVELQQRLRQEPAADFTASVTGLDPDHPLFPRVEEIVRARQAEL